MSRRLLETREIDLRRVFRLLKEITEFGRDPNAWRRHMLQGLLRLTGARVGICGEHYICPANPLDTRLIGLVDCGFEAGEAAAFYDYARARSFAADPLHAFTQRMLFRSFTRRRCEMVSDEIWYTSPLVNETRRRCNVDDTIHSRWKLPQPGWAQFVSLMRAWGDKPFGVRDRWVVSLVHRELGRLWSQTDTGPLAALPPRLRQTLELLLCGYSEKQMAALLGLSPHTVHDFARRLYRHFGVSGRGGLLTEPACRQLLFQPALSPAYYVDGRGKSDDTFPAPEAGPQ